MSIFGGGGGNNGVAIGANGIAQTPLYLEAEAQAQRDFKARQDARQQEIDQKAREETAQNFRKNNPYNRAATILTSKSSLMNAPVLASRTLLGR